jgi:hypothetical protein
VLFLKKMSSRKNIERITLYLTQTLTGHEVIPANFGWHIHKGNTYCGILQYGTQGWQGSALTYLPSELKEELKRFGQVGYSLPKIAA